MCRSKNRIYLLLCNKIDFIVKQRYTIVYLCVSVYTRTCFWEALLFSSDYFLVILGKNPPIPLKRPANVAIRQFQFPRQFLTVRHEIPKITTERDIQSKHRDLVPPAVNCPSYFLARCRTIKSSNERA